MSHSTWATRDTTVKSSRFGAGRRGTGFAFEMVKKAKEGGAKPPHSKGRGRLIEGRKKAVKGRYAPKGAVDRLRGERKR
jgi:hypothetical protein